MKSFSGEYIQVDEKIMYWVNTWKDLISNFPEEAFGLQLVSPHLIIKQIIDEISFNEFKNCENREYFYKQIDFFTKNDPVIRENFKPEFLLIRRIFNTGRNLLLLQYCENLLKVFKNGKYFECTVRYLKDILLQDSWNNDDEDKIKRMSQYLIIEFLVKGFSIETIQHFVTNIFHKYFTTESGHLYSYCPFVTDLSNFKTVEEYNKALATEIDGLNVGQRISKLSGFFGQEKQSGYFIFRIEGLKGDVDIKIGDVNFYSTKVKRYVKKPVFDDEKDRELFKLNKLDHINASVFVEYLDAESGKSAAVDKIDKSLSLLTSLYLPQATLNLVKEEYIIVNANGEEVGSGWSVKREDSDREFYALNLEEHNPLEKYKSIINFTSDFLYLPFDRQSRIQNKITNSVHWFRKAKEANKFEDKILNYWIVIENLISAKDDLADSILKKNESVSKYNLSKTIIPAIIISTRLWGVSKDIYWYLERYMTNPVTRSNLEIPQSLVEDCNLRPKRGLIFSLKPFVLNLGQLSKHITDKIVKEKVIYAQDFYFDNEFARKELVSWRTLLKNDVLQVYRLRNLIVHNAHFDNVILPYFTEKAKDLAGFLLIRVMEYLSDNKNKTFEDMYIDKVAYVDDVLEKLNVSNLFSIIDFG